MRYDHGRSSAAVRGSVRRAGAALFALTCGVVALMAPASAAGTRHVFVLGDSRHPGLEADRQAWNWLCRLGVTRHAVATKVDKLTQSERRRHLVELERLYSGPVTPVSAETGEGLDALWKKIASLTTTARP